MEKERALHIYSFCYIDFSGFLHFLFMWIQLLSGVISLAQYSFALAHLLCTVISK